MSAEIFPSNCVLAIELGTWKFTTFINLIDYFNFRQNRLGKIDYFYPFPDSQNFYIIISSYITDYISAEIFFAVAPQRLKISQKNSENTLHQTNRINKYE